LICSIFCGSGFFAAATFVEALCEAEADALAPGVVTGFIVAPVAGVVLADAAGVVLAAAAGVVLAAAAGVVLAVAAAAVALAFAAGVDLAFVFGVEATLALGDALALVAGAFDLLFFREFFVVSGVALVAGVVTGCSAFVAVGAFVLDFLSVFVVAGVVVAAGAGDSPVAESFRAGVLVFGAFVVAGFSARGSFFGGPCFLDGACDASGEGY
jgi:hypothetical protein